MVERQLKRLRVASATADGVALIGEDYCLRINIPLNHQCCNLIFTSQDIGLLTMVVIYILHAADIGSGVAGSKSLTNVRL